VADAGDDAMAPGAPLSVIVLSGEEARIHYALALVASARAIGRPATLFFTMQAIRALLLGFDPDADARRRAQGVAEREVLLTSCVELGARLIVCEMGLRAMGIDRTALRSDIALEIAGIVTLLDATPPGAQLTTL
jgi:peroxiredoxin family protein